MPVLTNVTILVRPIAFVTLGTLTFSPDAWMLLKEGAVVDVWVPLIRVEVVNGGV